MVTDDVSRMLRGLFPPRRPKRSDRASIGALADALTEMGSPIGPLLTHAVHTLTDRAWADAAAVPWELVADELAAVVTLDGYRVHVRAAVHRRDPRTAIWVTATPPAYPPPLSSDRSRSRAIRLTIPSEIELRCEPEDADPADHFEFPDDIQWVRDQLEAGNGWAWFSARVTVRVGPHEGSDSLGGCSYRSEADFCQPWGCYADMVRTAFTRAMGFDG